MRLLIVNPNTSAGVTRNIDAAAQAVARPGDVFISVSAAFGPDLIVSEADGAAAAEGVLASVKAPGADVDDIVLASFGDTEKEAVRRARPDLPVVGIASAAYAAARCLGGRFSIVTFDPSLVTSLMTSIGQRGLTDRLHRIEAAEGPPL